MAAASTPCAATSPAATSRDDDVRATIRRVHEERGYLLDPHSAIAYMGLKGQARSGRWGRRGSSWRPRTRRSSPRSSSRSSAARSRSRRRWHRRSRGRATSSASSRRLTAVEGNHRWVSEHVRLPLRRPRAAAPARRPSNRPHAPRVSCATSSAISTSTDPLPARALPARDFPKIEYAGRVDALRRRYPVLALHAREFVEVSQPELIVDRARRSLPWARRVDGQGIGRLFEGGELAGEKRRPGEVPARSSRRRRSVGSSAFRYTKRTGRSVPRSSLAIALLQRGARDHDMVAAIERRCRDRVEPGEPRRTIGVVRAVPACIFAIDAEAW